MINAITTFIGKIPSFLIEKTDEGNCLAVAGGLAGAASLLFPVFIKSSPDGASYIKLYEYIRGFLLTESGFAPLVILFILAIALSLLSMITGGTKYASAAAMVVLAAMWIFLFFSHVPIADCRAAVYTLSASLILQSANFFIKI